MLPRPPSGAPIRTGYADGLIITERPSAAADVQPQFTVTSIALNGDTRFRRSYRYDPRTYDGAALDTIVGELVRRYIGTTPLESGGGYVGVSMPSAPAGDTAAYDRALREAMRFPAFQPPIRSVRRAQDGTIWLMREEDGAATTRWTLLEPNGEPQRQLAVPRDITVQWSGGDTVWAVERDDLDVQWLVKYAIVPASTDPAR